MTCGRDADDKGGGNKQNGCGQRFRWNTVRCSHHVVLACFMNVHTCTMVASNLYFIVAMHVLQCMRRHLHTSLVPTHGSSLLLLSKRWPISNNRFVFY